MRRLQPGWLSGLPDILLGVSDEPFSSFGIPLEPPRSGLWAVPYAVTGCQGAPAAWGWQGPFAWRGVIAQRLAAAQGGMTIDDLRRSGVPRWQAITGLAMLEAGGDVESVPSVERGAKLFRIRAHA